MRVEWWVKGRGLGAPGQDIGMLQQEIFRHGSGLLSKRGVQRPLGEEQET